MITISTLLIIFGLALFEAINSIDNAVINAEVLSKVGKRARRWFLTWGFFFAVFVVRGVLPFLIVWLASPLSLWGALTATFSGDEVALKAIESSAPILLIGAGVFLLFIFLHWLFLEPKTFGLRGERFFLQNGVWFFTTASIFLTFIVWEAIKIDPMIAFGAVVGSSAFFLVNGFKEYAEKAEIKMKEESGDARSDFSKIVYLEMIDTAFSVDGVLGAFAFTLSIPLILIGNGIGAMIVRQMTVSNIDRIKKYVYLKNGAMYSILGLSLVMLAHAFQIHVPEYVSPVLTFVIIGYFFYRSRVMIKRDLAAL